MKKILKLFLIVFIVSAGFVNVNAANVQQNLNVYQNIIDEINEQYQVDLYILDEQKFLKSSICNDYNKSYTDYINNILQTDINDFKEDCMNIVNVQTIYNFQLVHLARSTSGKKTVTFNNKCNSMTLTYKYSGSKYDTSYKPTATVAKLKNTGYFVMSSYTGAFKNSNTTYAVTAKGKIYTQYGVASNKSFVVNFNL